MSSCPTLFFRWWVPCTRYALQHLKTLKKHLKSTKKALSKTGEIKKDDEAEVVFVCVNDVITIKQVKTGIQDDKFIQILSGINEHDEIVIGPYSAISKTLKVGDKVKKVSKEELFDIKPEAKK